MEQQELRKVTVMLPSRLIQSATEGNVGITAAIREGLQLLASRNAQRKILQLRGKVKLTLTPDEVDKMREDRD